MTPLWVIIGLNLVVFIAVLINQRLVYTLGLQPATILEQPWTIITSMFTHAEIWHIFANMLTFYFFGRFLLEIIGSNYMLIIYFCSGILGSLFYIAIGYFMAPNSIAIGASGAIFGLGGTLVVLRPNLRVIAFPIPVPMPLWVATLVGFLIMSVVPGIAWQAHLGGLICGLIAGLLLRRRYRFL